MELIVDTSLNLQKTYSNEKFVSNNIEFEQKRLEPTLV